MQISSNLHSNVSRSTRINSSSVHTYIFVCFTLRVFLQGFVTQNATGSIPIFPFLLPVPFPVPCSVNEQYRSTCLQSELAIRFKAYQWIYYDFEILDKKSKQKVKNSGMSCSPKITHASKTVVKWL